MLELILNWEDPDSTTRKCRGWQSDFLSGEKAWWEMIGSAGFSLISENPDGTTICCCVQKCCGLETGKKKTPNTKLVNKFSCKKSYIEVVSRYLPLLSQNTTHQLKQCKSVRVFAE